MNTDNSQSVPSLTVRDVAKKIRRDDEDLEVVVNRLRNWTKEGLLEFVGDKHPGSGKTRLYPESTVTDALVLSALTATGIPAVRIGSTNVLGMGRRAYQEFPKKEAAKHTIFMVIIRTEKSGDSDSYRAVALTYSKHGSAGMPILAVDGEVIIMVNMSSLFRRVQKRIGEE